MSGGPPAGVAVVGVRVDRSAPVPPPVITTVPLAGWVTVSTVIGPASTSVSLANTSTAVAADHPRPPSPRRRPPPADRRHRSPSPSRWPSSRPDRACRSNVSGEPPAGVAVVGVRLIGQPRPAAGDRHRPVGRLGHRVDRRTRHPRGRCRWPTRRSSSPRSSSATVAASSTATGTSSTQVTVTVTVAVEPSRVPGCR